LLQQVLFDTAESITFCPTVRPGREVSQAVREVCEHPPASITSFADAENLSQ